jgi:hypothetical protein
VIPSNTERGILVPMAMLTLPLRRSPPQPPKELAACLDRLKSACDGTTVVVNGPMTVARLVGRGRGGLHLPERFAVQLRAGQRRELDVAVLGASVHSVVRRMRMMMMGVMVVMMMSMVVEDRCRPD